MFVDLDGSPLRPNRVTSRFGRLVGSSDQPRIRLHDLRHSHAAALIAAGTHPQEIAERLGHSSAAFTLDTYGSALPDRQAAAARAAGALVDGM